MRNRKKIQLGQLDDKLKPFEAASSAILPQNGWIHTIRTGMNMTLSQLGKKLNLSKQGARAMEIREENGSISLKTLREFGEALDLKLVYGFVPKDGSFEKLVERKSEELARKIVLRTNQNMRLEDQEISNEKIEAAIQELTYELKRDLNKSIWD